MIHLQLNPPNWFYGLILSILTITAVVITVEVKEPTLLPLAQRVEASLGGVVRISNVQRRVSPQGIPMEAPVLGTGFFIGENLIITNNHVVDGGINPTIMMRNNTKPYSVEIIASDKLADVALIKITDKDLVAFNKTNHPKILELQDADDIVPGEIVYSLGHPWGFDWSVSQGIVSGVDRRFPAEKGPTYYLQTDAKIYSGNSGGPLINEKGQVVGMNTQIYVNDGGSFGFAIPGELLKKVIADLQEQKRVVWPLIGIMLGITDDGLVDIKELTPGKPAMSAGLKAGDVILSMTTSINGNVRVLEPDDLLNMLAILKAKDTVTLEVKRKDVIKMIPVVLDGKPSAEFL